MAVDVVRVRSRGSKKDRERAAKAKRQKILLAVCGVVLVALLALQGPKTLKQLRGGSTPAATTTSAPTEAAAGATGGTATTQPAAKAADLSKFPVKDPFIQQLGDGSGGGVPVAIAATAPAVRAANFVTKDPFVQQLTLTPPTTTPAPADGGKPAATKAGSGRYIVMLASVPVTDGRGAAAGAASAARKHGVGKVSIVNSAQYPTLRTGFYAVYSGPYGTLEELLPALEKIRGQGYPSAYTRRLAR
jgi:hypothetical protein